MKGGVQGKLVAVALGLAAMSACASTGAYAPGARYAQSEAYVGQGTRRQVIVENHSWDRVTIYLLTEAGATLRLGDVEAMNRAAFPVGTLSDDGGGMHFVAHPLAGTNFSSEGFLFPNGSTAVWTIENHYALSNVRVR